MTKCSKLDFEPQTNGFRSEGARKQNPNPQPLNPTPRAPTLKPSPKLYALRHKPPKQVV